MRIINIEVWRFFVFGFIIMLCGCGSEEISSENNNTEKTATKKHSSEDYSWMTMELPWQGTIDLPFVGNPHEKESELSPINLCKNSSFTVYVALGSVEYQVYNVVKISSDGRVIAAYKDPVDWFIYQREYMLNKKQLSGLLKVLMANNAGDLPASAISNSAESVLQGGFTLCSEGNVRRSYFSDSWLKQFKNIVDYVNDDILKYNPQRKNNGFVQTENSILQTDPEATKAVRGLIRG